MLPISEEYLHSPCEIYAKDNTPASDRISQPVLR